jgi:hypothetical protein
MGRYSKPRYPRETLEELQHVLELATEAGTLTTRSRVQIQERAITRRLGNEKIAELVAAYQSGQTTIQLIEEVSAQQTIRAEAATSQRCVHPSPTHDIRTTRGDGQALYNRSLTSGSLKAARHTQGEPPPRSH